MFQGVPYGQSTDKYIMSTWAAHRKKERKTEKLTKGTMGN